MIFDEAHFISRFITGRMGSLFQEDISAYYDMLNAEINNKSVLVIGGAGTIGSSFIKAILAFSPKRLYVVDQSENELTELVRDLRSNAKIQLPKELKLYPLNFSSAVFRKLFENLEPFDIVANFAAHKHVRSEKDHYAVEAMLRNNVFEAYHLLTHLSTRPPKHFFCVSTDKATNPVNVMGASKKLMEEVVHSFSHDFNVASARFANVAFSNGSLLHGFLQRLQKKQPLSCPRDIRRYFVSPEESGQICMLSCMLGDTGDILFPKLTEESMKYFKDIAEDFLLSFGLKAVQCGSEDEARQYSISASQKLGEYPVYFFDTDTSGEKPFEEFYDDKDQLDWETFSSLGVIKLQTKSSKTAIEEKLKTLELVLSNPNARKADVVETLMEILPDFRHIETGLGLDQKM